MLVTISNSHERQFFYIGTMFTSQAECAVMYMISFWPNFSLSVLNPSVLICGFLLYFTILHSHLRLELAYSLASLELGFELVYRQENSPIFACLFFFFVRVSSVFVSFLHLPKNKNVLKLTGCRDCMSTSFKNPDL